MEENRVKYLAALAAAAVTTQQPEKKLLNNRCKSYSKCCDRSSNDRDRWNKNSKLGAVIATSVSTTAN